MSKWHQNERTTAAAAELFHTRTHGKLCKRSTNAEQKLQLENDGSELNGTNVELKIIRRRKNNSLRATGSGAEEKIARITFN